MRRVAFAAVLVAGVAVLALLLSDRVLPIEVWATPGRAGEWGKDEPEVIEIDLSEKTEQTIQELAAKQVEVPSRTAPVVFVDAGHGGNDGGCFEGDIIEKNINLSIAGLVQDKLEALGYEVVMSRSVDTYVAKEDRVKNANDISADIYVSIHQNSSEVRSVKGMEVWYDGADAQRDSRRLALLVSQQTARSTGAVEREVRSDADFHVTGSTRMPACRIEYYFHPKTMYLTFDDGPSENTSKVLDILKERNIKATFFLVGENVEKHPEIARRIAAEGHAIGIHCYTHDYEDLYRSAESFLEDFERARRAVREATGVEAVLFRFPGGSINSYNDKVYAEIIKEMTRRGYIYYDWNASLEDAAAGVEPTQLIANGVQTTLGRKKVILLAHDVVHNTGEILEDLLDRFPEYEMLPLSVDVEPIHFKDSSAVG